MQYSDEMDKTQEGIHLKKKRFVKLKKQEISLRLWDCLSFGL